VPEINMGQLRFMLSSMFKAHFVGLNKIQGQPFKIREIRAKVEQLIQSGIQ
jgi:pyruvate/2-oxoacid:ferredoxin oxidoreductase alpha subunit